jgi:hypothetical protein
MARPEKGERSLMLNQQKLLKRVWANRPVGSSSKPPAARTQSPPGPTTNIWGQQVGAPRKKTRKRAVPSRRSRAARPRGGGGGRSW